MFLTLFWSKNSTWATYELRGHDTGNTNDYADTDGKLCRFLTDFPGTISRNA